MAFNKLNNEDLLNMAQEKLQEATKSVSEIKRSRDYSSMARIKMLLTSIAASHLVIARKLNSEKK